MASFPQKEEKKPYHSPQLKVHGDLTELTQASLSPKFSGGHHWHFVGCGHHGGGSGVS